ncbi:MAG: phosphoribosyltransferase [Candidatus Odinarchaeia archaeon]
MKFEYCTWSKFDKACKIIAKKVDPSIRTIFGIPRGGLIIAVKLAHILNKTVVFDKRSIKKDTLVVDDICDTGRTLKDYIKLTEYTATLYYNKEADIEPRIWVYLKQANWIVFPWEQKSKNKTLADMLLYYTDLKTSWVAGLLYKSTKTHTLEVTNNKLRRKLSQFFKIAGIPFKLKNSTFIFIKPRAVYNYCKKYGFLH